MPSLKFIAAAAALGALGGALGGLWMRVRESQAMEVPIIQRAPAREAAIPAVCAGGAVVVADTSSPRPTPAPKPVVDATPGRCP